MSSRRSYCSRILLLLFLLAGIAAALGYYYRTPILIKLADVWIIDEPARKSDAILVLGGGVGWRPLEAAKLFTSGYAPKVLVISVRPDTAVTLGIDVPEQDLVAAVLESKGVPASAITKIGNASSSTYEDIRAVADWAQTNKATDILIPTDIFHTRRVHWTAHRLLANSGIRSHIPAIALPEYTATNWWNTERGLIDFNNEVVKHAFYLRKY